MRLLLILLLFAISASQVSAIYGLLANPAVPIEVKAAPLLFAFGAVLAGIMLIMKSAKAYLPYFIGYAAFVALTILVFGVKELAPAAFGLVIGFLFFLPSVRATAK